MDWQQVEEIVYSESDRPHEILGPHKVGTQMLLQAFFPGAVSVSLCLPQKAEKQKIPMEVADEEGFFALLLPAKTDLAVYHYHVTYGDGRIEEAGDPYRYQPLLTPRDTEKFRCGIHYTIYEKLGAHPYTMGCDEAKTKESLQGGETQTQASSQGGETQKKASSQGGEANKQQAKVTGEAGTVFAVWAPNAMRVSVVGDFNGWDGRIHQMRRLWDSGIFEIFIPGAMPGANYKYEIKLKSGLVYLKSDPYGNAAQLRPETASVITDISDFPWEDQVFLEERKAYQPEGTPISIYEMYLGSFLDPADGEAFANYRDIAPKVIDYVQKMGYTHVEIMPVMEHPLDASWGYQVIGYYAPTARYGSPKDFMYFINELHKAGIGVILDWVPAHFPRDVYGLSNFDGTCLYEHQDPRQGFHPHWGTLIYNYGRPQVSNYLIANALFWVEKYHADGIRMDAVASMLYLDYGKNDGEWVANMYGGRENLEAIEFMKHLNSIMKKRNPGVLSIAEESTAFPLITGDLDKEGLGFDLKWNMGFMNDYLDYIKYDPYFRSYHHGELTFSLIYAYSEKFILVFSHDEVVHGKGTLMGKMPGTREQRFANLRLTYTYMMTHPGKKLLFMGQDLGEFDEWNERRRVEWFLENVPEHQGIQKLVKTLNGLYRTHPALHILDESPEGFEWVNAISARECYLAYVRKGPEPEDMLLVVTNFSGIKRDITVGVPYEGKYEEIFNSDDVEFGGSGMVNPNMLAAEDVEWDDRRQSITVHLAPLSAAIFALEPYTEAELEKVIEARIRKNTPIKGKKSKGKTKEAKPNQTAKVNKTATESTPVKPSDMAKGNKTTLNNK
jgi:1,4-alpha-glucan branching enzyme